jgi:hypothetical protein
MPNPTPATPTSRQQAVQPPARTYAQASVLLRRPFAPGAIGFRAMTKVPFNGNQYAGAQVAAFLNAQSVTQRLNAVVPGAWRQEFAPVAGELVPADSKKVYLACRLTMTLPVIEGGDPVDAVFTDIGEMDAGSFAGLKALYSDARKRAAVTVGIGAYLYTALTPLALPIGANHRQVQSIRRGQGKSDLLVLSPETEHWLREGYLRRMNTVAVRRDLGAILAHGEPETGMGQGDAADADAIQTPAPEATMPATASDGTDGERADVVPVSFAQLQPGGAGGPAAA